MAVSYTFVPKPFKLYYASTERGLVSIIPSSLRNRDEKEGDIVSATPSKAFAAAFLFQQGKDSCLSGCFGDMVYFVYKGTKKEFMSLDKGGVLYEVSSDNFKCDPKFGLGLMEWVSDKPVTPLKSVAVDSILEEMIQQYVQVYFVDEETFSLCSTSQDHGRKMLDEMTSENKKRNKNVRSLYA
ncbi:MAG: hypothetical protein ACK4NC_00805 [Candidatus Gracilibacteria bacterium]